MSSLAYSFTARIAEPDKYVSDHPCKAGLCSREGFLAGHDDYKTPLMKMLSAGARDLWVFSHAEMSHCAVVDFLSCYGL